MPPKKTIYSSLSHAYLNPPGSHYNNMGYWKETTDFVTANKALISLLVDALYLSEKETNDTNGETILDIGFGSGDQTLYIQEKYSTKIVGVEKDWGNCMYFHCAGLK